ncbi:hypothetical protein DFS34DRAFT_630617 [Phlyctochytrium arcticum]|nr:hypothetical protein DFS34DRAFT_630617 [Phlyctochytrium arcticum]
MIDTSVGDRPYNSGGSRLGSSQTGGFASRHGGGGLERPTSATFAPIGMHQQQSGGRDSHMRHEMYSSWQLEEEAQRIAQLNPDAPEFAPVRNGGPRSAPPDFGPGGSQFPEEGETTTIYQEGVNYTEYWGKSAMSSTKQDAPRSSPHSGLSLNTGTYTVPLKAADTNLDARDSQHILRRAASEGHIISTMDQEPQPSATHNLQQQNIRQLSGIHPNTASTLSNQHYRTPNPSPTRRLSVSGNIPTTAANANDPAKRDDLVYRTKVLLEHQMRVNLAFAEAVAAEYGNELNVRMEAQRSAFRAEVQRVRQEMEMATRQRITNAEDAIRHRFEERFGGVIRGTGSGSSDYGKTTSDRYAELKMDQERDQHQQHLLHMQQEVLKLNQYTHSLQASQSQSQELIETLRREVQEERDKRVLAEARAVSASSRSQGASTWDDESSHGETLHERLGSEQDFSSLDNEALVTIVTKLDNERKRLENDNSLLARQLGALEEDMSERPNHKTDLGSAATASWLALLQDDITDLETRLFAVGSPAEERDVVSKIEEKVSQLDSQSHRLRFLSNASHRVGTMSTNGSAAFFNSGPKLNNRAPSPLQPIDTNLGSGRNRPVRAGNGSERPAVGAERLVHDNAAVLSNAQPPGLSDSIAASPAGALGLNSPFLIDMKDPNAKNDQPNSPNSFRSAHSMLATSSSNAGNAFPPQNAVAPAAEAAQDVASQGPASAPATSFPHFGFGQVPMGGPSSKTTSGQERGSAPRKFSFKSSQAKDTPS